MRLRIWADQRKTQLGNFFKNVSTNAASRRNQVNTAGISKAFSGGGKPRITSEAIGSLEFTEKDRKLRVRIIGEITGKSRKRWIMLLLPVVLVLAACHSKTKANAPEVRPVRTVVAAKREAGETTVLLISGKPLGFVAILGILTLIGMIARNAVILIEQIETERKEGREAWNAVIEATLSRFRPIMLTAISTVLGLIPIAPTIFWGPMAYAIMGGFLAGTAITLIFLPALYVAWFRVKKAPVR